MTLSDSIPYKYYKDMVVPVSALNADDLKVQMTRELRAILFKMGHFAETYNKSLDYNKVHAEGKRSFKDYMPPPVYVRAHIINMLKSSIEEMRAWNVVTPFLLSRLYHPVPRTVFDSLTEYAGYVPIRRTIEFRIVGNNQSTPPQPDRLWNLRDNSGPVIEEALDAMTRIVSSNARHKTVQRNDGSHTLTEFDPGSCLSPIIWENSCKRQGKELGPYVICRESQDYLYNFYVADTCVEEADFITTEVFDQIARYLALDDDIRGKLLSGIQVYEAQDHGIFSYSTAPDDKKIELMTDTVAKYREATDKYFKRAELARNGYVTAAGIAQEAYNKYRGTAVLDVFHYPERLAELVWVHRGYYISEKGVPLEGYDSTNLKGTIDYNVDPEDLLDYSLPMQNATVQRNQYLKWHWAYSINRAVLNVLTEDLAILKNK